MTKIAPLLLAMLLAACGSDITKKGGAVKIDTSEGAQTTPDETPDDSDVEDAEDTDQSEDAIMSTCGDGEVAGDEACDGTSDVTCEELGFDGGFTQCSAGCLIDVSQCVRETCGDGILDEEEICDDGPDNGSYGACNNNCSAPGPHCGDGVANGTEACDGAALRGSTCENLGFDGGTATCSASCTLDTSSCSMAYCGDGNVDAGETCDDGAANGSYDACNASCTATGARCGDGVVQSAYEECDGAPTATCGSLGAGRGALTCTTSCTVDTAACSTAPLAAGELVITEIMQNPHLAYDNDGEWFELRNMTSFDLDLQGCEIRSSTSAGPESFPINRSAVVGASQYFTFARNANPGFAPDYDYAGAINLNNYDDSISLVCGSVEIDRVDYQEANFPDPEGASMTLNPSSLSDIWNDFGTSWCFGQSVFGFGDRGTPGRANDGC